MRPCEMVRVPSGSRKKKMRATWAIWVVLGAMCGGPAVLVRRVRGEIGRPQARTAKRSGDGEALQPALVPLPLRTRVLNAMSRACSHTPSATPCGIWFYTNSASTGDMISLFYEPSET